MVSGDVGQPVVPAGGGKIPKSAIPKGTESKTLDRLYRAVTGEDRRVKSLVESFNKYFTPVVLEQAKSTTRSITTSNPAAVEMNNFVKRVLAKAPKESYVDFAMFMRELITQLPPDAKNLFFTKANQKLGNETLWKSFLADDKNLDLLSPTVENYPKLTFVLERLSAVQPFRQLQDYNKAVSDLKEQRGEEGFKVFTEDNAAFIKTFEEKLFNGFENEPVTISAKPAKTGPSLRGWGSISPDFKAVQNTFGRQTDHWASVNGKPIEKVQSDTKEGVELWCAILFVAACEDCPISDPEVIRGAVAEMLVVGALDYNPATAFSNLTDGLQRLTGADPMESYTLVVSPTYANRELPDNMSRYEITFSDSDGKLQCTIKKSEMFIGKSPTSGEQEFLATSTLTKDFSNPSSDWQGTLSLIARTLPPAV